jgi:hypothetical protein
MHGSSRVPLARIVPIDVKRTAFVIGSSYFVTNPTGQAIIQTDFSRERLDATEPDRIAG